MKHILNLLALILVLTWASCSSYKSTTSKPGTGSSSIELNTSPSLPISPLLVVSKLRGFDDSLTQKINKATKKIDEVVNGQCFEDFMVKRDLIQTNNLTNESVVTHLRTSQATVELQYYYKWLSKVYGYTYPNVNKIWLNGKYWKGISVCAAASNLAHEWSHKIGYKHDYKATKRRPYSVPYSINRAFLYCCGK